MLIIVLAVLGLAAGLMATTYVIEWVTDPSREAWQEAIGLVGFFVSILWVVLCGCVLVTRVIHHLGPYWPVILGTQ